MGTKRKTQWAEITRRVEDKDFEEELKIVVKLARQIGSKGKGYHPIYYYKGSLSFRRRRRRTNILIGMRVLNVLTWGVTEYNARTLKDLGYDVKFVNIKKKTRKVKYNRVKE